VPADPARLVRLRHGRGAVPARRRRADAGPGDRAAAQDVPALAVLSRPAVEHGHGPGQERSGARGPLFRAGAARAAAQANLSGDRRGMAAHRRGAGRDHRRAAAARVEPGAAALAAPSLPVHRPAAPPAGGTGAPLPRRHGRRARPARHPPVDQRHRRRLAQHGWRSPRPARGAPRVSRRARRRTPGADAPAARCACAPGC
jgi:hypothetical protein